MNTNGRVTMVIGEDEDGIPLVGLEFPDQSIVVDPKMVSYVDGVLHVAVPATLDLPTGCVVIDRFYPPEREQVALAVANVSPAAVERLLMQEQLTNLGEGMGLLAIRAVARALNGETGAD